MNYMSVSEVAEVLGYSEEYLRKKCAELGFTHNGTKTLLNEEQVYQLKNELVPRTSDMKLRGQNATLEIEENEMIAKALTILTQRNQTLRQQLQEQTNRADYFEHENKLLMHTTRLYTVTEIAKELGYPSAIELNKVLEEKGIQYKVNGTWVPTAKFSSCGYFEIKQEVHDNGFVYYDRKVTQEGRSFILKLLA